MGRWPRKTYGRLDHLGRVETMDPRTKYVVLVLLSALIVAFESVAVEGAINIAGIDVLLVSSIPLLSGGLILLVISPKSTKRFAYGLGRRGWYWMTALCALSALGAFLWFDAVSRIGASKEAILGGGSSEVLAIVFLSAIFLRERLSKREALGSGFVLLGVFVVLANTSTLSLSVGFGEAEAILSSILLAGSVVIATYLLWSHDLTALSGLQLFFSGALLVVGAMMVGVTHLPDMSGFGLLVLIGIFPAAGLWTYNAGLPKIGASLTSILFALSGIMTVGVQLAVLAFAPEADLRLPQSVPLALAGGVVAFAGVYILNVKRRAADVSANDHASMEKTSAEGEI